MKRPYIVMAKDQNAIDAINYDIETPDQVLTLELTQVEVDFFFISGLAYELNRVCNIIIDEFEDEEIVGTLQLDIAITVLKKYSYSFPSQFFFQKLLSLFQEAALRDTAVFFFL